MSLAAHWIIFSGRPLTARVTVGGFLLGLLLALPPGTAALAQTVPTPVTCTNGEELPSADLMKGGKGAPEQPNLEVTGLCKVEAAKEYYYGQVNILNGGVLDFEQPKTGDPDISFWANSIIVEASGALKAGTTAPYGEPRVSDKQGGFLTIYLYGANKSVENGIGVDPLKQPGQGVLCKSVGAGLGPCGIPDLVWNNNGASALAGCGPAAITKDSNCIPGLPPAAKDYFYDYAPLYGDGKCTNGSVFDVKDGKALCGADPADGRVGYFGYKVLAVSYGGTLVMNGYKGVATGLDNKPLQSGNSWMRLKGDINKPAGSLSVDGSPGERWWLPNDKNRDQIVVTTTDYLPGHSEELTISQVQGDKVTFAPAIQWFHSGTRYAIASKLGTTEGRLEDAGMDKNLVKDGAETRAAVALLTRSIRIVSAGDVAGETWEQAVEAAQKAGKTYYFGGHTVFRQGIKEVQIDGVEFANLGQGGKIGHYPIHFHKTRQVPPNTFVDDSSVNESNTRWYVLHDTQGVTFQRDVGWRSIGHGYYLEDGTETDNNFYSDLGVFARAAINNPDNPEKVPGILADNQGPRTPPNVSNPGFPYRSDNENPTVFWITNGWNNFEGDMAAGAGACGAAYWFVPMENSDSPDVPTGSNSSDGHMKWDDGSGVFGYAGLQRNSTFAGATPLENFSHNYASSAYFSFQTTPDSPACSGFLAADAPALNMPTVREVLSFAPEPKTKKNEEGHILPDLAQDPFYPHSIGARKATVCKAAANQVAGMPKRFDCTPVRVCANGSVDPSNEEDCTATVLDHYTSSFTWAEGNYAGIWLRPQWYLVDNSVITDPQGSGLTFISGGDFTRSSVIEGDWTLLENSLLIGHTQPQDKAHAFASDIGPFNSDSGVLCDALNGKAEPNWCLNSKAGISIPLSGFFSNQRLFSIYDGPAYEQSNAFLDITTAGCATNGYNSGCIYGTRSTKGVLKTNPGPAPSSCYVANAGIAWKQPNGFFYPPSFHSANLFFNNVDIRHFVIQPQFKAFANSTLAAGDFGQGGTYITDPTAVSNIYCIPSDFGTNTQYFNSFTGIDRQTELNDDDGTLTGLSNDVQKTLEPANPLKQTISVNEDAFFTAPVETPECASNIGVNNMPSNACNPPSKAAPTVTAKTSPYDYVATVVFHPKDENWDPTCSNPECYGVPLYRQFLAGTDGGNATDSTREWKHWYQSGCKQNLDTLKCRWPFIRMAGENIATRETLTVNNGTYYIDTAVPLAVQKGKDQESYNGQGFNGTTTFSINNFVNVFMPGQTYTVFFVFAKDTTRQTYQIYLGKDAAAKDIAAVRVKLDTDQFPADSVGGKPAWLSVDPSKVASDGIISVTVDFTKLPPDSLKPTAANGMCQPHGFCTPDGVGGACVSTLAKSDARKTDYDAVCGQWAVKDLDCPRSGCYGFTFTIPEKGFEQTATVANPTPHRLQPSEFPMAAPEVKEQGKPTWLVKFLNTTLEPDQTKGQCHYQATMLPGTTCSVPDWVPQ